MKNIKTTLNLLIWGISICLWWACSGGTHQHDAPTSSGPSVVKKKTKDFFITSSTPSISERDNSTFPAFLQPKEVRIEAFRKDTTLHLDSARVDYTLKIDYPTSEHPHADQIKSWLAERVFGSMCYEDEVPHHYSVSLGGYERRFGRRRYRGSYRNAEGIARFMANRYFQSVQDGYHHILELREQNPEIEFTYPRYQMYHFEMRALSQSERLVSYLCITSSHTDGTPGYHSAELISYDPVHRREMTKHNLYINKSEEKIRNILFATILADSVFQQYHPEKKSMEELLENFVDSKGEWKLPQPGLSSDGVVYSFQPYEIAGYEAGIFHFCIPYDSVMPYLSDRAKWCLGIQ